MIPNKDLIFNQKLPTKKVGNFINKITKKFNQLKNIIMKENFYEWCPYCDHEQEMNEFAPKKCDICGKWVLPCAMCDAYTDNGKGCEETCKFKKYEQEDEEKDRL